MDMPSNLNELIIVSLAVQILYAIIGRIERKADATSQLNPAVTEIEE